MLRLTSCVAAFAAALGAQCPRPQLPLGGLPVELRPTETVTYSDGVVTEGHLMLPQGAPPACGWPLIVHVHPLGFDRTFDLVWQQELASNGYAVWAYDVRGQGVARTNNPAVGTTLYGGHERYDLAEQIVHVTTTHAALVAADRIAVTGDSQGGIHCWMAAVQSGRDLTVPGRGTIGFPMIRAVAGADFVTEPLRHRVRGGTLFSTYFVDITTGDPANLPFHVDATLRNEVRQRFLAQDPAGLVTWMESDPARLLEPDLPLVTTPIFFNHAWHDSICGPGPILEAIAAMPATTPVRLLLSTVGHAVPVNDYETRYKRELTLRWLERFLWDEPNGVDEEMPIVLARMPLDPVDLVDTRHAWTHAHETEVPAADVIPLRLYTVGDGTLSTTEPTTSGPPSHVFHRVETGYDAQDWLDDPSSRTRNELLTRIPLSEATFTWTLTEELELAGAPRVHVRMSANAQAFTLAALLSARLPGGLEDRMLSHWGVGKVQAITDASMDLEFELGPIATTLPAGTVLELSLRNHWLTEPPHLPAFVTVPMFTDSHLTISHGSGGDSTWIELPVRNERRASLVVDSHTIDATAPGVYHFEIDAGIERENWVYLLGCSFSGHTPGIPLPGGVLPIQPDFVTIFFVEAANSPELLRFAWLVDAAGKGHPVFDLSGLQSLPVQMLGTRASFAAWVFRSAADPSGVPTNPVDLVIR